MEIQLLKIIDIIFRISVILIILAGAWLCIRIPKYLFNSLTLKKYISETEYRYDSEENKILDNIINEMFQEYLIFNIAFRESLYINTDLEKQMMNEVSMKVLKNISPNIIGKLSLYYNIGNLEDIVASKVYMIVSQYVIQNNTVE